MTNRWIIIFLFCSVAQWINADSCEGWALGQNQFGKNWVIESESPDYKVVHLGDTLELTAPKGLTLWSKHKLQGNVTIEYDACAVVENDNDRLSDMNCFWMASDPQCPNDIMKRSKWRNGIFNNCYSLQLYYLGYGGNHNSTTRFRRYTGDEAGITDSAARPAILREYTDPAHLLTANQWRHIKITTNNGRTQYFIDGERLVDYMDPEPLTEGWFGFRTTLARMRVANFTCTRHDDSDHVSTPLHWVGEAPVMAQPVTFGVPFVKGAVAENANLAVMSGDTALATDTWPLAYWPDGSVKWMAFSAVTPGDGEDLSIAAVPAVKGKRRAPEHSPVRALADGFAIDGDGMSVYVSGKGGALIDSIVYDGVKVAENLRLVCRTQSGLLGETTNTINYKNFKSRVDNVDIERAGKVRNLVKITGVHVADDGAELFPFVVRAYIYKNAQPIQLVHTVIFDGDAQADFVNALGMKVDVPMRDALYNRHVAFDCGNGGVWSEPVEPLVGRRVLKLPDQEPGDNSSLMQQEQMAGNKVPDYNSFDARNRKYIDDWATWDCYRLSQPNPDGFTIRKRANSSRPWIGTHSGNRTSGYAFVGDMTGGMAMQIQDFWQSCPTAMEINGATSDAATLTAWLWSPDAEPMDLRHYDDRAHDLDSSYEDVQEGMSTPTGIARTSTITIIPEGGYKGKHEFAKHALACASNPMLMPTPQVLHDRKAFGVWSIPDRSTPERAAVEDKIDTYIDFYKNAIEQNRWYGFWNYGDVMHAYDPVRHCWKYDVGGFAWDNTELGSNMWLWYNFLRTGRADIWQMAVAMARHTSEVDVYHAGEMAGLGSRHNVVHWGCGAKEARISQSAWNRFYYYLAADERSGDLMDEVTDADQMLYTLDPMRLAEPRSKYPCTAPARLRIGPDWLAYAGNWMTHWERTRDDKYRDKIVAGMKSICALPSRMFTGPLALGYDPATGVITSECDPKLQTTNHLMTIMGGFEIMNEMMEMIPDAEWEDAWLEHARYYKQKAREITHNRFRVSRLASYAAYKLRDPELAKEAWDDLLTRAEHTEAPKFFVTKVLPPEVPAPYDELNGVSTNDAAMWSLDAIYMQEVLPQ